MDRPMILEVGDGSWLRLESVYCPRYFGRTVVQVERRIGRDPRFPGETLPGPLPPNQHPSPLQGSGAAPGTAAEHRWAGGRRLPCGAGMKPVALLRPAGRGRELCIGRSGRLAQWSPACRCDFRLVDLGVVGVLGWFRAVSGSAGATSAGAWLALSALRPLQSVSQML